MVIVALFFLNFNSKCDRPVFVVKKRKKSPYFIFFFFSLGILYKPNKMKKFPKYFSSSAYTAHSRMMKEQAPPTPR
jgi:hypothetical protein